MTPVQDILDHLEEQRQAHYDLLCDLLRIPSISAQEDHRPDMQAAARWTLEQLEAAGLSARIIETSGHPLVYGENLEAGPDRPTALVYGHYDVQPPDPLDEWVSPPFEPDLRDGKLFARGASDDKGQFMTHVFALQAWHRLRGGFPVNVKVIIEGEEEIGSVCLSSFVAENSDMLACENVIISDSSQFGPDRPAITYGLRGMAYFQLDVTGPAKDLHSGSHGGVVANPIQVVSEVVARMKDNHGRVEIPGFYEDVVELQDWEREMFASLDFSDDKYLKELGAPDFLPERGFTPLESRWARPTLDVNGIWGGYMGEGAKTVIPSAAGAKISMRLVPDQDPVKLAAQLEQFINAALPDGVKSTLQTMHGGKAVATPRDSPGIQAAERAIEKGFGVAPVFIREGGTIPIVEVFQRELAADPLLLGWGQDDDDIHAPNEKFVIEDFYRGIMTSAHLWEELAQS